MCDNNLFDFETERKEVISFINSEGQKYRTLLRQWEAQKDEIPESDASLLRSEMDKPIEKILIAGEHLESLEKLRILQKECEKMQIAYPEGVQNKFFQGFESNLEKTMQESAVEMRQKLKTLET